MPEYLRRPVSIPELLTASGAVPDSAAQPSITTLTLTPGQQAHTLTLWVAGAQPLRLEASPIQLHSILVGCSRWCGRRRNLTTNTTFNRNNRRSVRAPRHTSVTLTFKHWRNW